jgi:hypothetical protein
MPLRIYTQANMSRNTKLKEYTKAKVRLYREFYTLLLLLSSCSKAFLRKILIIYRVFLYKNICYLLFCISILQMYRHKHCLGFSYMEANRNLTTLKHHTKAIGILQMPIIRFFGKSFTYKIRDTNHCGAGLWFFLPAITRY